MMREKYESLSAAALKDIAKARGLRNISTLKKSQLVERMLRRRCERRSCEGRSGKSSEGRTGREDRRDWER